MKNDQFFHRDQRARYPPCIYFAVMPLHTDPVKYAFYQTANSLCIFKKLHQISDKLGESIYKRTITAMEKQEEFKDTVSEKQEEFKSAISALKKTWILKW